MLLNKRFPLLGDPGPVLNRILERFFPGLLQPVQPAKRKDNTWAIMYAFDQYLWQPEGDSKHGIGLFFNFGATVSNPNPIHYSYMMGIGDKGVIPGRPDDNFGIGRARTQFSDQFERGLADGRHQPTYEDDVSYINHYGSIDLDIELSERFSFSTAFHYERNNWTSQLESDERNGAFENAYQSGAILSYRINKTLKAYTGIQYSSRKESFEAEAAKNLNIGFGLAA